MLPPAVDEMICYKIMLHTNNITAVTKVPKPCPTKRWRGELIQRKVEKKRKKR